MVKPVPRMNVNDIRGHLEDQLKALASENRVSKELVEHHVGHSKETAAKHYHT